MKFATIISFLLMSLGMLSQTAVEMQMISEINVLRSNPKMYKEYVSEFVNDKRNYYIYSTTEAKNDIESLINCLDTIGTLDSLMFDSIIYESFYSHKGIDSVNFSVKHDEIFNRVDYSHVGENIINSNRSVRDCIIILLIDYGVSDKGHRKNLLDKEFNSVAVKEVKFPTTKGVYYIQDFGKR